MIEQPEGNEKEPVISKITLLIIVVYTTSHVHVHVPTASVDRELPQEGCTAAEANLTM